MRNCVPLTVRIFKQQRISIRHRRESRRLVLLMFCASVFWSSYAFLRANYRDWLVARWVHELLGAPRAITDDLVIMFGIPFTFAALTYFLIAIEIRHFRDMRRPRGFRCTECDHLLDPDANLLCMPTSPVSETAPPQPADRPSMLSASPEAASVHSDPNTELVCPECGCQTTTRDALVSPRMESQ